MTTWIDLMRKHWLPTSAVLLAAITALSLWPLEHLPPVPGGDKLHHAIAYAVLMFPAALRRPRHLWAIFLFYLAWSGCIELIQPYVQRYGEWLDLAANTAGLSLSWLLVSLISTKLRCGPIPEGPARPKC